MPGAKQSGRRPHTLLGVKPVAWRTPSQEARPRLGIRNYWGVVGALELSDVTRKLAGARVTSAGKSHERMSSPAGSVVVQVNSITY